MSHSPTIRDGQPQPTGYTLPTVDLTPSASNYPHVQQQPPPIVTQPTLGQGQYGYGPSAIDRIAVPAFEPNLPPSLQYLSTVNQLYISQEIEIFEVFIGFETANRYSILNSFGQRLYYAMEESGWLNRWCCGTNRAFTIRVLDNYRQEVIRVRRGFVCCNSCWCPCCMQSLEVFSPPDNLVGTVEQKWSLCTPLYDIKNKNKQTEMKIQGPICRWDVCGDLDFKVYSADNRTEVGVITKKWSGLMQEVFTDADFFGISFPLDLDLSMKAVMIGACFLIDFMYFESKPDPKRR